MTEAPNPLTYTSVMSRETVYIDCVHSTDNCSSEQPRG